MLWPTIFLLLTVAGARGGLECRCDMVEVNHVCDADGCVRFSQVIAWEWLPDYCVYRAQDWHMTDGWHIRGKYLTFHSGSQSWKVRFGIYRETWTQNDPELDDRKLFNASYRIKVFR